MTIWAPARNKAQGLLVAGLYHQASSVPCEHAGVMAGGLPGADTTSALAQAHIDRARYLMVSIDTVMPAMATRGLIPPVQGLSSLEAADLAHTEAQFLAKRLALRGLADGRNLLFDISMASPVSVQSWIGTLHRAGYSVTGIFTDISVEESVRRTAAAHRRGHDQYRAGLGYGGRYIPPEAIRALADTLGLAATTLGDTGGAGDSAAPGQFPGNEITTLLAAYICGQRSLEDLVREFRARRWPPVPPVCPPGLEAATAAIDDPEPYVPGSFDDVVLAYDLGKITDADYQALAIAAAA